MIERAVKFLRLIASNEVQAQYPAKMPVPLCTKWNADMIEYPPVFTRPVTAFTDYYSNFSNQQVKVLLAVDRAVPWLKRI